MKRFLFVIGFIFLICFVMKLDDAVAKNYKFFKSPSHNEGSVVVKTKKNEDKIYLPSASRRKNQYNPPIYTQNTNTTQTQGTQVSNTQNVQNTQKINGKYGDSDVISFVIDYSGSMDNWIQVALNTVTSVLPSIPNTTKIGARAFGQRGVMSCRSKMVVPFMSNQREYFLQKMSNLKIGGVTPLARALEDAAYDDFDIFDGSVKKKIILVTDGVESCNGDPCSVIKKISRTRPDIKIDIILVDGSRSLSCANNLPNVKVYNTTNENEFTAAIGVSFEAKPEQAYTNAKNNVIYYEPLN